MRTSIGLLGAGRQALESSGYCREAGCEVAFYIEERAPLYARDLNHYGAPIYTIPRLSDVEESLVSVPVLTAVGDPALRRRLVERWPGTAYATLVSADAWVGADVQIGSGCTIAPRASLNRFVELGSHVIVNVASVLSHDVVVGDYATFGPGCVVGGWVRIGVQVFVGIGATISDHITVGDRAFVAAGAVVVEDVAPGQRVMGVPARPISSARSAQALGDSGENR